MDWLKKCQNHHPGLSDEWKTIHRPFISIRKIIFEQVKDYITACLEVNIAFHLKTATFSFYLWPSVYTEQQMYLWFCFSPLLTVSVHADRGKVEKIGNNDVTARCTLQLGRATSGKTVECRAMLALQSLLDAYNRELRVRVRNKKQLNLVICPNKIVDPHLSFHHVVQCCSRCCSSSVDEDSFRKSSIPWPSRLRVQLVTKGSLFISRIISLDWHGTCNNWEYGLWIKGCQFDFRRRRYIHDYVSLSKTLSAPSNVPRVLL